MPRIVLPKTTQITKTVIGSHTTVLMAILTVCSIVAMGAFGLTIAAGFIQLSAGKIYSTLDLNFNYPAATAAIVKEVKVDPASAYPKYLPTGGKIGGAYEFDGTNAYLGTLRVKNSDTMTIEATVMHTGASSLNRIIGKAGNFYIYWLKNTDPAKSTGILAQYYDGSAWNGVDAGEVVNDNVWYHVAATYQWTGASTIVKTYINGQLKKTAEFASRLPAVDNNYNINIGQGFKGIIDEVKIYDWTLTDQEIANRYAQIFSSTNTAGNLSVALAANSPAGGMISGDKDQEMAYLNLTATGEAVDVTTMRICDEVSLRRTPTSSSFTTKFFQNYKIYTLADGVKLAENSTVVPDTWGTAGNDCMDFNFTPGTLIIPSSSTIGLKITGKTSPLDDKTADFGVRVGLKWSNYIKATGISSGLPVNVLSKKVMGNLKMFHKSYPKITTTQIPYYTKLTVGGTLYELKITNPSDYPVAIYRLTFKLDNQRIGDLRVKTCALQAKKDGWADFKKIAPDIATAAPVAGVNYCRFVFWNPDNNSEVKKELRLNAGESATFQLIGQEITGLDAIPDEELQVLLNVSYSDYSLYEETAEVSFAAPGTDERRGFCWSDLWRGDGSDATALSQWYNGFLIDGLSSAGFNLFKE